jgi:excisionase family DNA binding protein
MITAESFDEIMTDALDERRRATHAARAGAPLQSSWLTVDQVAAQLGMSRRTVFRLIEQGLLQVARVSGRLVRVPAQSVDRLMEQSMAGPGA